MKHEYLLLGTNEPTIVIEVGVGNSFYSWYQLAEEISKTNRVLLYHRLGYGGSSDPVNNRTTDNISYEFNQLVDSLGINDFILLAHSFGGLCAQSYLMTYPEKLKAVVLLDSTPREVVSLDELNTPVIIEHCSIKAMISYCLKQYDKSLDELYVDNKGDIEEYKNIHQGRFSEKYKEFILRKNYYHTVANEFENWQASCKQLVEAKNISDVPVRVISRDREKAIANWVKNGISIEEASIHEDKWRDYQENLLSISTNSSQVIAKGCDHMIHQESPTMVLEQLKEVMKVTSL